MDLERLQAEAKSRLEPAAFAYLATGAAEGITERENVTAWQRFRLRPRILRDVTHVDISTKVLGTEVSMPVLVAPIARQGLFVPEAEMATADAAGAVGVLMVVSSFATLGLETIMQGKSSRKLWFQLYVTVDRGRSRDLIHRAEGAGYSALVLTVDTPVDGLRRYDPTPDLPSRGKVLGNFDSVEPNGSGLANAGGLDASVTFHELEWLRAETDLPIVVKGVQRADDAVESVRRGASAVVVSNHGGRQMDRSQPTALVLREVVEAVGNVAEVYVDGGIRSGTDTLVALALGAQAVLIGRPAMWALATGGGSALENLLEWLAHELKVNMQLCGARSLADLDSSLVTVT